MNPDQLGAARPHLGPPRHDDARPSSPRLSTSKGSARSHSAKRLSASSLVSIARGGEPRTLTITQTASGAWRACVGFRASALQPLPETQRHGGVDRGIWVTAALPDGTLLRVPSLPQAMPGAQIAEPSAHNESTIHSSPPSGRGINKAVPRPIAQAHHRSENWARHCAIDIVPPMA